MKKYLLLIGVIISFAIQASAAKEDIYMTIYRKGNESIDKTIHRSPMLLPVDVFYNTETHQIEVTSDDEMSAQVLICDENGNTLDYSPCINAVLDIPSNHDGLIIIRIEGDDWIAIGKIAI